MRAGPPDAAGIAAPTGDHSTAPTGNSAIVSGSERTIGPTREATISATRDRTRAAGPTFDAERAWAHLAAQVAFGPRPAGSAALEQTRQYILDQLAAAGIAARRQPFVAATPIGAIPMANIVATIPGRRAERVALGSHFDTKLARNFRFVGANDGASSTAALLELGRALQRRQNEFTIELLFFDGEEAIDWEWRGTDNTYGSRHYVQAAQQDGSLAKLRAFVLLDMIGDRDLRIRRDANSTPWLVDLVWSAAGRLGHRGTFVDALTVVEDDHIPFLRAGVPAVDIIDLNYPAWHTASDDLDRLSRRSLQIVGDVVLAALPDIETRLAAAGR
jgi:glutaminyl-peptide cyclotransferase